MKEKIGLGGGCHWCTEAIFQALKGVEKVDQGFIASTPPNEEYSEAVIVYFDNEVIQLEDLIEVHLRTHASTSNHSMRSKYRSAIYTFSNHQADDVSLMIEKLQSQFDNSLVTEYLQFESFKQSEIKYHNYYDNYKDKAFCKMYIDPKLTMLRNKYSKITK